jgi:hypothetical protein
MTPCLSEKSLQVFLDGELAADARSNAIAHLSECDACATNVQQAEQELAILASALEDELPAAVPTARLRARIESALAETASPKLTVEPLFGRGWQWPRWRVAAVAAGILILISAMAILWQSKSLLKPKREGFAVLPAPINTPYPPKLVDTVEGRDQVMAQQPKSRSRRVRRQAPRSDPEEVELVTRFFPLMEGDDFSSFKSNQIVRVELSGSALRALGLPIDGEMLNRSVKADVVLRHDGLARAIRFVHQRMPSASIAGE